MMHTSHVLWKYRNGKRADRHLVDRLSFSVKSSVNLSLNLGDYLFDSLALVDSCYVINFFANNW